MSYYPTAEELLSKNEDRLLELKRSPRSMLGLLSFAAILFFIVSILCYAFGDFHFFHISWFSIYLLYLVPIGVGIEALRRYHDDLYIFEQERVTQLGGRLSLQYSVPAIRYVDIRAMSVTQSFAGRIFDYGNLELNTAAMDQGELYLEGIRAPDDLAYVVEALRRHHLKRSDELDD